MHNSTNTEGLRQKMIGRFTLLSLLAFMLIGITTGWIISIQVKQVLLESFATATANTVRTAVSAQLSQDDIVNSLPPQKYQVFSEFIAKNVLSEHVVKVKLWRPDGTVIYSNDATIVGKKFGLKSHLRDALSGEQVTSISDLRSSENVSELSSYSQLVEIYAPVYLSDSPKVSAVYEAYVSIVPLQKQVNRTNLLLAIALTILFTTLFFIVEIASKMLRKQNESLRILSNELKIKADTDGLTGLHNYRHFQDFLEVEIDRSHRYGRSLSLLLIDLDFFKKVNDRYGHQTGDQILTSISRHLEELLRKIDYVARYGGEEFVIVLPETDSQVALEVAERIRRSVSTLVHPYLQDDDQLTISIGVADFPLCAAEGDGLIAAADAALLFAKRHGRNRVCHFRDARGMDLSEDDLERLYSRLENASITTLEALSSAVDAKDNYYGEHSKAVSLIVQEVAPKLGLDPFTSQVLHLAAQLHDIGKIAIPDSILNKSSVLDPSELEMIRSHPAVSHRIVESAVEMEQLHSAILHHHENYDGSGYPHGLKANDIPRMARILRVIDSYHAMINERPYRVALMPGEALRELERGKGSLFDPQITDQFIAAMRPAADQAEEVTADS